MATSIDQSDYVRTALRVPRALHETLHEAAQSAGKSFNQEIIGRLMLSFDLDLQRAINMGRNQVSVDAMADRVAALEDVLRLTEQRAKLVTSIAQMLAEQLTKEARNRPYVIASMKLLAALKHDDDAELIEAMLALFEAGGAKRVSAEELAALGVRHHPGGAGKVESDATQDAQDRQRAK